ncbi:hypothetical protein VNO77_32464 [Canavalia gladiata]|uniref:Uncharacterized protein n=1 Tax=Canavalia gladiata TaxID=3824 RepID=A0AAN9Q891_CANGL
MEEKKSYPSLPPDYVTIAQLQKRWLKKQNQINQPQPQQQQLPLLNHHQPLRNRTASPKQYRVKNQKDSQTHRATEATSDDRRKSEAGDAIGDENTDLDGKVGDLKKKWINKKKAQRKPKAKESRASEGAAAQGSDDAEKTTIESELNNKKNNSSITVEEVEQRVRVLSMNSKNDEQSGRWRKMNNGFRHSQSQKDYYSDRHYDYDYGYRYANGQKVRVQKRDKMIWVRKDGNVGEFET